MFSFNSPFGACEGCNGLGIQMKFDPDLIIPDREKSIAEGAVALYRNYIDGYRAQYLGAIARHFGFSVLTPVKDLTPEHWKHISESVRDEIESGASGVVIAQGTDTLGYCSAALSFALQSSPVPIAFVIGAVDADHECAGQSLPDARLQVGAIAAAQPVAEVEHPPRPTSVTLLIVGVLIITILKAITLSPLPLQTTSKRQ
jgi:hypothetical protein